jgi:hypothetical protein
MEDRDGSGESFFLELKNEGIEFNKSFHRKKRYIDL